jgi:hypothetical protein
VSVTVEHVVHAGDVGAAAGGGGLGRSDGDEGREHRVPTEVDGWFVVAARRADVDPMSVSWLAG